MSSASTTTPAPASSTGAEVITPAGVVLPNPARTPGATNPDVTSATIAATICVSGWTSTVRPPASYTTSLKVQQLASGYAYHGDMNTGDYEEDHLISLELGGSPRSPLNLWPEPYAGADGARVKDQIENKLHSLVCEHRLTLSTAQHAIATNWYAAYLKYIGSPPTATSTHTAAAPPPTRTTSTHVALSCAASVSDASPAQYSTVDVLVHTSAGAGVSATAHYKTTDTTHTGTAGNDGLADIAFRISRATIGYSVSVDVSVTAHGASAGCSTAFTPS